MENNKVDNERKNKILKYIKSDIYIPLKFKQMMVLLEVPKEDFKQLEDILNELITEGKIKKTKKGKYIKNVKEETYEGTLVGSNRGFSFFEFDDKDLEDIYIPLENVHGAINKDRVEIKIVKRANNNKKSVGVVTKIIERKKNNIIGIVERQNRYFTVIPFDKKMNSIDIEKPSKKLKEGDIVSIKITKTKKEGKFLVGEIQEIIGHSNNSSSYLKAIIMDNEYSSIYPKDAVEEAIELKKNAFNKIDYKNRKDLRKNITITIDGKDAKDLDDAITIDKNDKGNYILGVHIADVAHYVKENSKLDKQAYLRGNSVYLVDTVIPMLPTQLSNDICSLNPNVDRLTLSVIMEIDATGSAIDFEIAESVIKANERMTYEDVQKIIENDKTLIKRYSNIQNEITLMSELCDILINKRKKRGTIDFNFKESKIILDEKKNPIKIDKYDRAKSNRMIEEFMIVCNETVAQNFAWLQWPFIYRNHEKPDESKIDSLNDFVKGIGLSIKSRKNIHPQILQDLVNSVKGTKLEHLINKITLRALKKAVYSANNIGHFGLASEYYCHFTSPIRRYPDLIVHRLIKASIQGKDIKNKYDQMVSQLEEIAKHCSTTERKAELAERDLSDVYKAMYMKQHVGSKFDGVISGVIQYGLFVELENTVEGFIRVDYLDGYYNFDKDNFRLYKEKSNFSYSLGEKVRIKIINVNIPKREIDMTILKKLT